MNKGATIEAESFRMIEEEIGDHDFTSLEFPLVRRVIHATADFDLGRSLVFSEDAVTSAMESLRIGSPVITDIQMVASGISKALLQKVGGGQILCRIADQEVKEKAVDWGLTRSAAAMRSFGTLISEAMVVIGNAPTALREVLRLYQEERIRPRLLVAVPVGFVDAAESKEALLQTDLTSITNRGRKGGTPAAVAIVNALLRIRERGDVIR